MMTQTHCHTHNYPSVHVGYPYLNDENIPSPPPTETVGQACASMPESESAGHDSQKNAGGYQAAAEMPLWLSPTEVRSAMEKDSPLGKELNQALKYRSVFICTAMISMIALGLIMTI